MKLSLSALALTVSMSGCTALKPVSIPIEVEHISHLTQHEPFTDHPTNYGLYTVSAGLKWEPAPHFTITLMEGINVNRGWQWREPDGETVPFHGGLMGGRETFQGRITYEIPLR